MKASSILTPAVASDDFSRRQVLPLSAAIRPVRFARRDWEVSAQVRDVLDSFETTPLRPAPRAEAAQNELSIIMEGNSIQQTMRTGSHVVRQRYTSAFADDAPLAIAPEAYAPVADASIQAAASVALAALNDRKPSARRGHRLPAKRLVTPRTASTGALWIAFAIATGVVAMLVKVAVTGVLI